MYSDGEVFKALAKVSVNCDLLEPSGTLVIAAALNDLSERYHWVPILLSPLTLMQFVVCSGHWQRASSTFRFQSCSLFFFIKKMFAADFREISSTNL